LGNRVVGLRALVDHGGRWAQLLSRCELARVSARPDDVLAWDDRRSVAQGRRILDADDFGRRAERAAEKRRHRAARTQPADHDREPEAAAIGDLTAVPIAAHRRAPLRVKLQYRVPAAQ